MSEKRFDLEKNLQFNASLTTTTLGHQREKVNIDIDDKKEYWELLAKLNEIMFSIFKKGPIDAGYISASLAYVILNKQGVDREISQGMLEKLLQTYFQTFNSPYSYSIFIHAFIIRWFRLILLLDLKSQEIVEFLSISSDWRKTLEAIRIFKFIDKPFRVIPILNLNNPEIPLISPEDREMIDDLIKGNKGTARNAGGEFIKFYHLIIKRVLHGDESIRYLLEIQSLIGPTLVKEFNKEDITDFIMAIGEYYHSLQEQIKLIISHYESGLSVSKIDKARKRWIANNRFSGISFSNLVKTHRKKKHQKKNI